MMNTGIMKQAVISLNEAMREVGREVNAEEVVNIVEQHAIATAVSAAASGAIPGAGGLVALGIACTSTITMYGRLANVMGCLLYTSPSPRDS